MQLLYPIGLLAFAGLIIPVIIHLWSVKKGKTLKIGSINLLGESANATSRSLRITDWLLFVMRCLLLIIVGLILAQPLLQKKFTSNSKMGWILIDQNQSSGTYLNHKKTIDSLLNLGFELHDFNIGFKQFELKDSLQKAQNSTLSYSSILRKLNTIIPNGYSTYLFAPKKIADFEGNLPKVNYKLNWFETKTKDTLKTWSTDFLGKKYEAKSSPTLTSYTSKTIQDLPSLTAMIYEPKGNDSKYVKAALNTIKDFTQRKIEIKEFNANLSADITFWFSEQEIPASFLDQLKPNSKVLSYVNGKVNTINSNIQLNSSAFSNIDLYQKIDAQIKPGEVIWKDGFGQPVLVKQQNNHINYFYFYSKFNPQWTDLVWNEAFVNALLPIVVGDQNASDFGFENNENDQRVVNAKQNLFIDNNKVSAFTIRLENIAIANYLWILALVVLIVERILSFRKTNIKDVKN